MDDEILLSKNNFISELNKRIDLYNNSNVINNLDSSNMDKIVSIIHKYYNKTPDKITNENISNMDIKDVKKILNYVGLTDKEADDYLKDFESNKYTSQNTIGFISNINKYFEDIKNLIVDYVNISNSQKKLKEEKINLYKKYIDLLSKDSFDVQFNNFKELDELMGGLGLSESDKWHILYYINKLNINTNKYGSKYANVLYKTNELKKKYLNDKDIYNMLNKQLNDIDLDIDLIPSISSSLSKKMRENESVIKNGICVLTLENLLFKYKNAIVNKDTKLCESLYQMINKVFELTDSKNNEIINRAKEIIISSKDLYNEYKSNNKDLMKYVDITISEIEKDGVSHEKAIILKELPLVKTISETLDKIELISSDSKEYDNTIELLSKLEDAYNELDNA